MTHVGFALKVAAALVLIISVDVIMSHTVMWLRYHSRLARVGWWMMVIGMAGISAAFFSSCGYTEAEMQSQRDQIQGLQAALVDVSTAAETYQTTIARLTGENERLKTLCTEAHP
jgi:uncharacterized membrane protein